MTIDEIIQIINVNIDKNLTPLQETILRQTWEGKTYANIANDLHYKQEYIRRIASHLWNCLTKIWGFELGKNNFRCTLEPKQLTEIEQKLLNKLDTQTLIKYLAYPDYPLPIDCPLYIERPPLEKLAYEEIVKPCSLIRIKGSEKYGKSSLILRILNQAKKLNYQTVTIDFQQADKSVFASIDQLLRWLSLNMARELGVFSKINDYWNDDIGSKVSCSIYVQVAILEQINTPLVLALNEVNRLFEYPDLAEDFFSLLRYWYEQGKQIKTWEKLRLVVAYSTEIYIPINLNHSPFNIGLLLKLTPLNLEQVKVLMKRYGLEKLKLSEMINLLEMVGGHPYLIQIALYNLFQAQQNHENLTLENILANVFSNDSIYANHLQIILANLKQNTELNQTFLKIINHHDKINRNIFSEKLIDKLDAMGLIICDENNIIPSCNLYAQYFQTKLSQLNLTFESKIIYELQQENEALRNLSQIDELTQVANRHYFNKHLQYNWDKLMRGKKPLSIIICDLDFLKIYNDSYGLPAGDECLKQIAKIVQQSVRASRDLIARYGGEELAIILPDADVYIAFQIAAKIRDKVRDLKIPQSNKVLGIPRFMTVSLGLATMIPNQENNPEQLLDAALAALSEAKENGRDQVTISSLFNYGLIDH